MRPKCGPSSDPALYHYPRPSVFDDGSAYTIDVRPAFAYPDHFQPYDVVAAP